MFIPPIIHPIQRSPNAKNRHSQGLHPAIVLRKIAETVKAGLIHGIFVSVILLAGQVSHAEISQTYRIDNQWLEDTQHQIQIAVAMTGTLKLSLAFSEPVVVCNASWAVAVDAAGGPLNVRVNGNPVQGIPASVIEQLLLENVTLSFAVPRARMQLLTNLRRHEISCNPGVMAKPNRGISSTPMILSPSWDKVFRVRGNGAGESPGFARESDAVLMMEDLLRNGFAELNSNTESARIDEATADFSVIMEWLKQREKYANEQRQQEQLRLQDRQQRLEELRQDTQGSAQPSPEPLEQTLDPIESAATEQPDLAAGNTAISSVDEPLVEEPSAVREPLASTEEPVTTTEPATTIISGQPAAQQEPTEEIRQIKQDPGVPSNSEPGSAANSTTNPSTNNASAEPTTLTETPSSTGTEAANEHRDFVAALKASMLEIPAGRFRMGDISGNGDADEKPVHWLDISAFAMSDNEITFEQWDACVEAGACQHQPADHGWGRGQRPVINISYQDITDDFIPWINRISGMKFRLPSEAEWEYAARAGTETLYHWGDQIDAKQANCDGCGSAWDNRKTAPVRSFPPNAFGLHDMHGNVWELTDGCWTDDYAQAPTISEPASPTQENCLAPIRGGSWFSRPNSLRSSNRDQNSPATRESRTGFRLAADN